MIIEKNDPRVLDISTELLESGHAVIAPCDTIYGLLGKVPDADDVIRQIKGRGETKPFLQLILPEWINDLTPQRLDERLLSYWPGPLTLVVKNRQGGTTAYRAPDDPFLISLLTRVGTPLYSTSVNHAGSPPLNDIEVIIHEFDASVPMIINGGDLPEAIPSTLLDVTTNEWNVLRQGALRVPLRE